MQKGYPCRKWSPHSGTVDAVNIGGGDPTQYTVKYRYVVVGTVSLVQKVTTISAKKRQHVNCGEKRSCSKMDPMQSAVDTVHSGHSASQVTFV